MYDFMKEFENAGKRRRKNRETMERIFQQTQNKRERAVGGKVGLSDTQYKADYSGDKKKTADTQGNWDTQYKMGYSGEKKKSADTQSNWDTQYKTDYSWDKKKTADTQGDWDTQYKMGYSGEKKKSADTKGNWDTQYKMGYSGEKKKTADTKQPEDNEEISEAIRHFAAGDTEWLNQSIFNDMKKNAHEKNKIDNEGVNSWTRQESQKENSKWEVVHKEAVPEMPSLIDRTNAQATKPKSGGFEGRGGASGYSAKADSTVAKPYGTRPSITSKPKLDNSWWAGSGNTEYDETQHQYQGMPNEPREGTEMDKIKKEKEKDAAKKATYANDAGSLNRKKIKEEVDKDTSYIGELARYEEMAKGIKNGMDFDLENNPKDRQIFEKYSGKSPEELAGLKTAAWSKLGEGQKKQRKARLDYFTQDEFIQDGALALSLDENTEIEEGIMRGARTIGGDVVGSVALVGESLNNTLSDMEANLKNKECVEKEREITELEQMISRIEKGQKVNQQGGDGTYGRLGEEYYGEMGKLYKGKEEELLAKYKPQLEAAQEELKKIKQVSYNDTEGFGYKMKEAADEDLNKLLKGQPTWVKTAVKSGKDMVISAALGPVLGTGYSLINTAGEEVQASTAAGESSAKAVAKAMKGVSIEVAKSMLLSAVIDASQMKTVTKLGEVEKLTEEQMKAIAEYVDKVGVEMAKEYEGDMIIKND